MFEPSSSKWQDKKMCTICCTKFYYSIIYYIIYNIIYKVLVYIKYRNTQLINAHRPTDKDGCRNFDVLELLCNTN